MITSTFLVDILTDSWELNRKHIRKCMAFLLLDLFTSIDGTFGPPDWIDMMSIRTASIALDDDFRIRLHFSLRAGVHYSVSQSRRVIW